MFTSKLHFSFLPNFPLGPCPFFRHVPLLVSQTSNDTFTPSCLSLGFNGNKQCFHLLVILNNATTFAASKHERVICFLVIPCSLKIISSYIFWAFPRDDGATQPPSFRKSKQRCPSIHSRVWRNCASPRASPQLGCGSESCLWYSNHCFLFPSSLLFAEFLLYQEMSSSPTKTQVDKIFYLPVHWPEPLWLTSSSEIFCIHRRCHGVTHSEFMCKANQVYGHGKATAITSVFPSLPGADFFEQGQCQAAEGRLPDCATRSPELRFCKSLFV